jgi:hypothetical protein
MASGYEKEPDYGGPEPWLNAWVELVLIAVAFAIGVWWVTS